MLAGWAVLARYRQVQREHELALAWIDLGHALDRTTVRLNLPREGFPDAWELTRAAESPDVQARLDSAEARIWQAVSEQKPPFVGADSLREDLRRKRERQGLALAHCRTGREGWVGHWALRGFPNR